MRWGLGPPLDVTSWSSRARVNARCEPRLSPAIAWISSTTIVRTPRSVARERSAVKKMKSDSAS